MTVRKSLLVWQVLFAAATLAIATEPARAQSEFDSTTGRIYAEIASSVGLTETAAMSFGWMAQPASPGTARLTPANTIESSGLAIAKIDGASPARIVISGAPNQVVGVLVGDFAKFKEAGREVSVSSFTHNGGLAPALGPDGRATIELGATLRLAGYTRDGRYRGAFDVIVSNN
jgi:hypothetical protein